MGQYEHDVGQLEDLASRLSGLRDEFNGLGDRLRGYEVVVGHGDVSGALSRFASNWSDKRKDLGEKLDQLSGYVTTAAESYAGMENELTKLYTVSPPPTQPMRAP